MVLFLTSVFMISLNAQKPTYSYFDSLTYRLFLDEQWDALSDAGESAIDQGYDGYYLQIRTGIALFNRGQYRRADKYLTRAFGMSPNEVSGEYSYLTKLWGGRTLQAEALRERLPEEVLKHPDIKGAPKVRSVGASATYLFSESEITEGETSVPQDEVGSRLSAKQFMHYGMKLSHRLGRMGRLTHEIGLLNRENVLYIGPSDYNDALWIDDYQTNQYNYYLLWERSMGRNWNLHMFGNGLWFDFPVYGLSDQSTGNNRWAWDQSIDNGMDYVLGAGVTKSLGLVDLSVEVAGSSMAHKNQFQTTASALFYPLYNLNLYAGGWLTYNQGDSDQQFLGGGTIGGRLTNFFWLEASALMANEARFFHLRQGNLVFNGTENVNEMLGVNAIFLPWKGIKWIVSWQRRQYVDYFLSSDISSPLKTPIINQYQLISTSVLWTF